MGVLLLEVLQLVLDVEQLDLELAVAPLKALVVLSELGSPLVERGGAEDLELGAQHLVLVLEDEHVVELDLHALVLLVRLLVVGLLQPHLQLQFVVLQSLDLGP